MWGELQDYYFQEQISLELEHQLSDPLFTYKSAVNFWQVLLKSLGEKEVIAIEVKALNCGP